MSLASTLDTLHARARANRWLGYFAVFCRVALAAGFLPSGMVKIMGERFTGLPVEHPMGHYLEALHLTGYYYTLIGIVQVSAAILLLIPRTATLGAVIYFPIILNICILSLALRFEGSLITSPLMVLANLYLLCWDYHKLKFILPFHHRQANAALSASTVRDNSFPFKFFAGVGATVVLMVLLIQFGYSITPRIRLSDCKEQCTGSNKCKACEDFCACIHVYGQPLDSCLAAYNAAAEESIATR
ncbi:MAG: DoxX family protein [Flavobacteriales bacterium]